MVAASLHISQTPASADESCQATIDYCRQARRLRHRHDGNPARLHQSLRTLARQSSEVSRCDGNEPIEDSAGESDMAALLGSARHFPGAVAPAAAVMLANEVAEAMDSSILRYSQRMALLRRGEELGIGRFETNLIIARVQHHNRPTAHPAAPARRLPVLAIVTVAVLEGMLIFAAWSLFGV